MYTMTCIVDIGVGRKTNDDRVLLNCNVVRDGYFEAHSEKVLALVCDGVGGELYGDVAAELVVTHFSQLFDLDITTDIVYANIINANEKVIYAQKKSRMHSNMSTTLAGIYINGENFIVFNIGDSRVYRFRPPYLAQLSIDHSMSEELKNLCVDGTIAKDGTLTRYIGSKKPVPDIIDGKGKVFDCDVFIVCSDGISDVLSDEELEKILSNDEGFTDKTICEKLITVAKNKNSRDNLSVVIIRSEY